MSEIRKLVIELPPNERVETGPVQFNDDWPGFFIRGDYAFAIRLAIANVLFNPHDVFGLTQLRALATMLDECNINKEMVKEIQKANG